MATEKRQRVRFTGKRTGLEAIQIKGIGLVHVGDVIEVSEEEAERWTTLLPMRDGKEGADFVKSGGPTSVDEDDVAEREQKQFEKFAAKQDPDELTPANTELAHGIDEDSGTVEEYAERIAEGGAEINAEGEAKGVADKGGDKKK